MRELITTLLDVLGLLLIAAGATAAAALILGWGPALAAGGVVVLAGSLLATWLDKDTEDTDGE